MSERGKITPQIDLLCQKLLGNKLNTTALRLIPHILYKITNGTTLTRANINEDDLQVLRSWNNKGYIDFNIEDPRNEIPIEVSKQFYDVMCEIAWYSYVECKLAPPEPTPVTFEVASQDMLNTPGEVYHPVGYPNDRYRFHDNKWQRLTKTLGGMYARQWMGVDDMELEIRKYIENGVAPLWVCRYTVPRLPHYANNEEA